MLLIPGTAGIQLTGFQECLCRQMHSSVFLQQQAINACAAHGVHGHSSLNGSCLGAASLCVYFHTPDSSVTSTLIAPLLFLPDNLRVCLIQRNVKCEEGKRGMVSK
ncbi:MAG: hypothetical protein IKJ26_12015 [Clostridia bacterium]|nr:hypothetical protein [Clostridia bacterium]